MDRRYGVLVRCAGGHALISARLQESSALCWSSDSNDDVAPVPIAVYKHDAMAAGSADKQSPRPSRKPDPHARRQRHYAEAIGSSSTSRCASYLTGVLSRDGLHSADSYGSQQGATGVERSA